MISHLQAINESADKWNAHRIAYSDINLRGVVFRVKDFSGFNLEGVDFTGTSFELCEFNNAKLGRTNLTDALFIECKLTMSSFELATGRHCKFKKSEFYDCSLERSKFYECEFTACRVKNTLFVDAKLDQSELKGVYLESCNFERATLYIVRASNLSADGCNFANIKALGANFGRATLMEANFTDAELNEVDMGAANIREADFTRASLFAANLERTNCFRTIFESAAGIGTEKNQGSPIANMNNMVHEEDVIIGSKRWYIQWQFIRKLGELPLFGVSYFGIAAIAIWTSAVHLFNEWTRNFQKHKIVGHEWVQEIPRIFVSLQTVLALIGLVLIAAAATIYKLACPPEIQEYNETKWAMELKQPRLRYRAMGARSPLLRTIAAFCYSIGCPIVVSLLGWRIAWAIVYAFTG